MQITLCITKSIEYYKVNYNFVIQRYIWGKSVALNLNAVENVQIFYGTRITIIIVDYVCVKNIPSLQLIAIKTCSSLSNKRPHTGRLGILLQFTHPDSTGKRQTLDTLGR